MVVIRARRRPIRDRNAFRATHCTPVGETDGYVRGALRWKKSPYPNFEDMDSADGDNVYEVVVTATDGGVLRNSKDVTVTVENTEEAGSVSLSQRRPQEGIPITATLNDKDGNISKTAWQWYGNAGLGVNGWR